MLNLKCIFEIIVEIWLHHLYPDDAADNDDAATRGELNIRTYSS